MSCTLAFTPTDDAKIFLEGHRFTAQEAIENKLVDEVSDGDSDAVFQAAMTRAVKLSYFSRLGVYGLIKVRM
jgi:enoyl-CoA hydratase/carnithine racemase